MIIQLNAGIFSNIARHRVRQQMVDLFRTEIVRGKCFYIQYLQFKILQVVITFYKIL